MLIPFRTCFFGIIQLAFLYAKLTDSVSHLSYSVILSPCYVYLAYELVIQFIQLTYKKNLEKEEALEVCITLLTVCLSALSLHFLTEYIDDEDNSLTPVFIPPAIVLFVNLCVSFKQVIYGSTWIANGISLITPALSTCTVTGTCNSFYISTLSSFLSAFGISVVDMSSFLAPITA